MKKILSIMLACIVTFSMVGCNDKSNTTSETTEKVTTAKAETEAETEAAPKELKTVNVAYMPNYASLATVVPAIETGAFEEQGLKVNLVEFADGPTIIAAMESGSIDFGYIGPGAHKLCINGRAKIFALAQVGNSDEVIGRTDKGINSREDLKGKKVAYASGTSSEAILKFVLDSVGLTMDDIQAIEMDASAIATAMVSGSIDACATWSPNTFSIKDELGDKAIQLGTNNDFLDRSVSAASWIVMNDYAEKNHDLLVRFTKGLYKGMDYRSKVENTEQNCKWVAAKIGVDYDSVYQQRGDAEWIDSSTLVDYVNSGKLKEMYKVQQDSFIADGSVEKEVPVEDYVLFDIMLEAAGK